MRVRVDSAAAAKVEEILGADAVRRGEEGFTVGEVDFWLCDKLISWSLNGCKAGPQFVALMRAAAHAGVLEERHFTASIPPWLGGLHAHARMVTVAWIVGQPELRVADPGGYVHDLRFWKDGRAGILCCDGGILERDDALSLAARARLAEQLPTCMRLLGAAGEMRWGG